MTFDSAIDIDRRFDEFPGRHVDKEVPQRLVAWILACFFCVAESDAPQIWIITSMNRWDFMHVSTTKMFHPNCTTFFPVGSQLLSFKSLNDEPRDFSSMFTSPKRPTPLTSSESRHHKRPQEDRCWTAPRMAKFLDCKKMSHMHHSDVYRPTINTLNPSRTSIHIFVSTKNLKLTHLDKGARLSFGTSFKVLTGLESALEASWENVHSKQWNEPEEPGNKID